jgi:hypothetical protein
MKPAPTTAFSSPRSLSAGWCRHWLLCRDRPVEIRAGDALGLLPEALAECPAGGSICVFHTMTTYQFSKTEREALENVLTLASVRRPL